MLRRRDLRVVMPMLGLITMISRFLIHFKSVEDNQDAFSLSENNGLRRTYKEIREVVSRVNRDGQELRDLNRMCVAILTGYPDTADRYNYVTRLLNQLRYHVIAPGTNNAKYDLHLFCEGHCTEEMFREKEINSSRVINTVINTDLHLFCEGHCTEEMFREKEINSSRVINTVPYNMFYHSLYGSVHRTKRHTLRKVSDVPDTRRLLRRFSAMFPEDLSNTTKQNTYHAQRWFFTSGNYFELFEILFRGTSSYAYCTILEDDLLLSRDALLYLRAGERLLENDSSVFTVSLFNDNSFPLYARDCGAFRRVSHFAGLGFVMSRVRYLSHVRLAWSGHRNWDVIMQYIVAKNNFSSIIPEVSRALHVRNSSIGGGLDRGICSQNKDSALYKGVVPRHLFESQMLNDKIQKLYDLSELDRDTVHQYLNNLIRNGIKIARLSDALYFDENLTLIYTNCKNRFDLNEILMHKDLWGFGNGHVIRGSYLGTMFFRYYNSLVLIVCQDSSFYKYTRINLSIFSPNEERTNEKTFSSSDGIFSEISNNSASIFEHRGIMYRLQKEYDIITGDFNESCDYVCSKVRRRCDLRGLWLINEQCSVILFFMKSCVICKRTSIDDYVGVVPGMDRHSVCRASYAHYISCSTYSHIYQRLCTCI